MLISDSAPAYTLRIGTGLTSGDWEEIEAVIEQVVSQAGVEVTGSKIAAVAGQFYTSLGKPQFC